MPNALHRIIAAQRKRTQTPLDNAERSRVDANRKFNGQVNQTTTQAEAPARNRRRAAGR